MKTKHRKYAYGLVAAMLMTGAMPALGWGGLLGASISKLCGFETEGDFTIVARHGENGNSEFVRMRGRAEEERERGITRDASEFYVGSDEPFSKKRLLAAAAEYENRLQVLAMNEAEAFKKANFLGKRNKEHHHGKRAIGHSMHHHAMKGEHHHYKNTIDIEELIKKPHKESKKPEKYETQKRGNTFNVRGEKHIKTLEEMAVLRFPHGDKKEPKFDDKHDAKGQYEKISKESHGKNRFQEGDKHSFKGGMKWDDDFKSDANHQKRDDRYLDVKGFDKGYNRRQMSILQEYDETLLKFHSYSEEEGMNKSKAQEGKKFMHDIADRKDQKTTEKMKKNGVFEEYTENRSNDKKGNDKQEYNKFKKVSDGLKQEEEKQNREEFISKDKEYGYKMTSHYEDDKEDFGNMFEKKMHKSKQAGEHEAYNQPNDKPYGKSEKYNGKTDRVKTEYDDEDLLIKKAGHKDDQEYKKLKTIDNDLDEEVKHEREEIISDKKWHSDKTPLRYEEDEKDFSNFENKMYKSKQSDKHGAYNQPSNKSHEKTGHVKNEYKGIESYNEPHGKSEKTKSQNKQIFEPGYAKKPGKSNDNYKAHNGYPSDNMPQHNKRKVQEVHIHHNQKRIVIYTDEVKNHRMKGEGSTRGMMNHRRQYAPIRITKEIDRRVQERHVFSGKIMGEQMYHKGGMHDKFMRQHNHGHYGAEMFKPQSVHIQIQNKFMMNMHAQHGKFCERGREMGMKSIISHDMSKRTGSDMKDNVRKTMQFHGMAPRA